MRHLRVAFYRDITKLSPVHRAAYDVVRWRWPRNQERDEVGFCKRDEMRLQADETSGRNHYVKATNCLDDDEDDDDAKVSRMSPHARFRCDANHQRRCALTTEIGCVCSSSHVRCWLTGLHNTRPLFVFVDGLFLGFSV
jgi:hypothetical protein